MEMELLPHSTILSNGEDNSSIIELDGPAVWSFLAVNSLQVATDWAGRF